MACLLVLVAASLSYAAVALKPFPGLADPGSPVAIHLEGPDQKAESPLRFVGPDERLQLVVSAAHDSGQLRDWTKRVGYAVTPAGVVHVSRRGLVIPVGDGEATITATDSRSQLSTSIRVAVERFADPPSLNFANQVVPVFTKLGCNSGACHGKSGGQNGFRLSLLGFEPARDYEYLVKESRGRRLFPAAPDSSLLLLKASNAIPHGGGERLKAGTHDYRVLRRWIAQGMPVGRTEDPTLKSIAVYPPQRIMPREGEQQLRVVATYTDGTRHDVTGTAQYEPNNEDMAEIDEAGGVRMLGRPGDVAVMVRYQGQVATFVATVPLGLPVGELPKPRNFVDEKVAAKWKQLGLPPSPRCSDAEFLRRVTLDITGRLPDAETARAFLADTAGDKRDRAIDRLLASSAYADYFANKWASILRNKRRQSAYARGNFAFHHWIRAAVAGNVPFDQFVRQILTASGRVGQSPPVAWFRQVSKTDEQVEDTAQLFLGVRIQCARCHHHPFEKWSQDDYYGLAAFFSRVGKKGSDQNAAADAYRVYHKRGAPSATNPSTKRNLRPTGLGAEALEISPDDDPRGRLADWITAPDNPFFARALVNRYWKHFFGRGLVEPEDDMRASNPPVNPALLDALAEHFVASGFDVKDLIRTICRSNTYQLTALPNEHNTLDTQSFSRFYPRRLPAEVLLDAIDQFNGSHTAFQGLPEDTLAVQIPDHGGVPSYFLQVFGRPAGSSACECERASNASLAQSLHLLNSRDIHNKLASGQARILVQDQKRSDEQKITDLYFRAFGRPPLADELATATAHIQKHEPKNRQAAYEDLVWVLINTKEFLFNH